MVIEHCNRVEGTEIGDWSWMGSNKVDLTILLSFSFFLGTGTLGLGLLVTSLAAALCLYLHHLSLEHSWWVHYCYSLNECIYAVARMTGPVLKGQELVEVHIC